MRELNKTILFTSLLSAFSISLSYYVQTSAQKKVNSCSYLDPIIIDILAYITGLFLIIDGIYDIYLHSNEPFKKQITRAIRIAFGFAIVTIHTLQFLHK